MRAVRRVLICVAVLVSGLAGVPSAPAETSVPVPVASIPPDGLRGFALWDSYVDLAPFGYEEQELFVTGLVGVVPYTTRIIVFRPSDPAVFNGTVLLDWVNVTAQFENAVDTMEAREMLLREGFAFVHVSAQAAGICCTPLTPKVWDPVRYAALSHPGDAYAADMFSQVAQLMRTPAPNGAIDPMGGLEVERVLAAGQSQSASKLYSYASTTDHDADVIDGILIHGGGEKSFDDPLDTKVIHLLSDNEADVEEPGDDDSYRLWEVGGTSHTDMWIGYQSVAGLGPRTIAGAPKLTPEEYEAVLLEAGNYGERPHPMHATCVLAGQTMPMRYAVNSALLQLDRWVRGGEAPVNGPRFQFDGTALARDADGNTLGGIRLPPVDVPIARYQSTACPLGGVTVPFTEVEIAQRYPTHAGYVEKMQAATDAAVAGGWLLSEDAADLMVRAQAAKVRWPAP